MVGIYSLTKKNPFLKQLCKSPCWL